MTEPKYYHIQVMPKGKCKKNAMITKTGERSTYLTKDVGKKGGMKRTLCKTREGGPTKTQKIIVERKDFTIKRGKLVPKTKRGQAEYRSIVNKHGVPKPKGQEAFRV